MTASPQPVADLAGTVLENAYRLVRLIGRGGMGAVYEAVQLRLNKRVAVKIMSRELTSNMVSLARFHREAEITSKLGHPNLVNVIDYGTAESGEPYLVMDYLEGQDLEKRLEKDVRLPLATAVRITRQAASALGAAHAQDIIHRDLKPANIFLQEIPGEPEFVKVLDFGISKVKAASARLTRARAVIGTPCYMSPEQATGRVDDTDHRADQWALACIAWEMLTGQTPFMADEVGALFYQITTIEPEPLAKRAPDAPAEVEAVLRRALSKRFTDRYPTIRDFGRALESAALGQPSEVTPSPLILTASSGTSELSRPHGGAAWPASSGGAKSSGGSISRRLLGTTVIIARMAWSRWRAYTVSAMVLLVLSVAGLLWLKSSRASSGAVQAASAAGTQPAVQTQALASPANPSTAAASAPATAVEPTSKPKSAKGKGGGAHGDDARTPAAKRKSGKVQTKRRIFQEL